MRRVDPNYTRYTNSDLIGKVMSKFIRRELKQAGFENFLEGDRNLLDAGCGLGHFLMNMGELYPSMKLYGVDLLKDSAYNAAKNAGKAHIVTADIQKLPFRKDFFDIVVSSNIFDCCEYGDKNFNAINFFWEARRVLKQGGIYFVNDIHLHDESPSLELQCIDDFFTRKRNTVFVKE